MFGKSPSYLSQEDFSLYRALCYALYFLAFFGLIYGIMTFLFPYTKNAFDSNKSGAIRNVLFAPHTEDFTSLEDVTPPADKAFIFYANNWNTLESADITVDNTKNLSAALNKEIVFKRGIAATFFPQGTTVQDIPIETFVQYQGVFYQKKDDILYPFVSETAAQSHQPLNTVTNLTEDDFASLTKSDTLLGFRVGTLLAYADGVFVVAEDGTIRPFGSADILLRLGYTFDHVLKANAEDVGIYPRGKIILPGQLHPAGTLFQDIDSQKYFVFEQQKLIPLTTEYAEFLKKTNDIVTFSSVDSEQEATCVLQENLFHTKYSCQADLTALSGAGDDYQASLQAPHAGLAASDITVGLQASRESTNAHFVAGLLWNRVLQRIGL